LSSEQILDIIRQITDALIYLEQQGIVHRDLKPENILYSIKEEGKIEIKLNDFGIAKYCRQSQDIEVQGTFPYISPECFCERKCSFSADMWSLGVIWFELVFEKHPFKSRDMREYAQHCFNDSLVLVEELDILNKQQSLISNLLQTESI